jgi:hypothetical protein
MKMRDAATPDHHFYLVDGPSGIGKTQLPFSLSAGETGVKIVHLLMTIGERPMLQEIYLSFIDHSVILSSCLGADLTDHPNMSLGCDALRGCLDDLWTVAFFLTLLGRDLDQTSRFTVQELRSVIENLDTNQRPIIFLDEVLTHVHSKGTLTASSPEALKLQLVRNILRSVGLVVVLMGTNTCAANFLTISGSSRGPGSDNPVWCQLITELPRSTDSSLQVLGAFGALNLANQKHELQGLVIFLREQFVSCLPWFVENFVASVKDIANLIGDLSAVDLLLPRKFIIKSLESGAMGCEPSSAFTWRVTVSPCSDQRNVLVTKEFSVAWRPLTLWRVTLHL